MLSPDKVYSGNSVEFSTRSSLFTNLVPNNTNHTRTRCVQEKQ